jgi:hypothetical protein
MTIHTTPITNIRELARAYPEFIAEIRMQARSEERKRYKAEYQSSAAGEALMEQAVERSNAARRARAR